MVFLERVPQLELVVDRVVVATTAPLADEVAAAFEIVDDLDGGSFGDAHPFADVAQTEVRCGGDRQEHVCVIGQEGPLTARIPAGIGIGGHVVIVLARPVRWDQIFTNPKTCIAFPVSGCHSCLHAELEDVIAPCGLVRARWGPHVSALLVLAVALGPLVCVLTARSSRRAGRPDDRSVVAAVAPRAWGVATALAVGLLIGASGRDTVWSTDLAKGWADLGVDRVAAVLVLAIAAIGTVIVTFTSRALDSGGRTDGVLVWLSVLIGGSVLVAAPGGPIPLLVGWIASGIALRRLVRGWVGTAAARTATGRLTRATGIGDLALIGAVVVGAAVVGPSVVSGSPSALAELDAASLVGVDAGLLVGLLLIVAGAARSALVPFHRWLSATLYAPTPVSAVVHAGYVSAAGVLLIRFAPITVGRTEFAVVVGVVAVATVLVGSAYSLSRPDTKGRLAWSTVAQMGFMVVQCAVGAFAGVVVHLVGHAMYKAAQFLGAGDTVAAGLRERRRPVVDSAPVARPGAWLWSAAIATIAVVLGALIGPHELAGAERALLFGAAWFAIAAAVSGILSSGVLRRPVAVAWSGVAGIVAGVVYFAALRGAKRFLDPSLPAVEVNEAAAYTTTALLGAGVVALAAVVTLEPLATVRYRLRAVLDAATIPRLPSIDRADVDEPSPSDSASGYRRVELRAQLDAALEYVAPTWPLSSFVAVNPLGGLEHDTFDDAAQAMDRLTRGRSYRSLAEYRTAHHAGNTTVDDLARAAFDIVPEATSRPALTIGDRTIRALDVVLADLLDGPEIVSEPGPRTELERRLGVGAADRLGLDDLVGAWVADSLGRPSLPLGDYDDGFWNTAVASITRYAARLRQPAASAFVRTLGDDPLVALGQALDAAGIDPVDRPGELAGIVVGAKGWIGLSRWRNEWAHADERTTPIEPVEIVAALAALHTCALLGAPVTDSTEESTATIVDAVRALDLRTDAVLTMLGIVPSATERYELADILADVSETQRHAIWQRAQELHFDEGLLTVLDRVDPGNRTERPASQIVFCIDVRSEGIRRHVERSEIDMTLGFAGFFGIPMSVREYGWERPEARCPVLVAPHTVAAERPFGPLTGAAERRLAPRRRRATIEAAHSATKHLAGAQFATAEATGWITGPRAGWKTIAPPRKQVDRAHPATVVAFDDDTPIDQMVFWGEAVLRTMSLTDGFARLVVLCGHTSETVNNAHATALECGACAGAGGAGNARAVATLLNRHDVRAGLRERGIDVPDDVWFTGGLHETTSDIVTLLDEHLVPDSHRAEFAALQQRLDVAGAAQATDRAALLPGPAARVRDRGNDWAQVRPEWGLASNAAFVIAPRSTTLDLDLGGRTFLHSYDARLDPDGSTLETIMTAPLIVGHWISSQYYFSTTDPDVFGAGDKLLHNPIGTLGVVTGAGGDLRVGLPLQSTHVGDRAHHQPLRLLAVVQADVTVIDDIIKRNPVLQRLVQGSWIRIAARSTPHEPWSTRSANGAWVTMPRPHTTVPALERS